MHNQAKKKWIILFMVALFMNNLRCSESFQVTGSTIVCSNTLEKMTHTEAAKFLGDNNIVLSSYGNCIDRENPKCTSLEQVNCESVCGIARYKLMSGCQVVISAGTEVGHELGEKSHYNGFKLDIALSVCNNNYILKSFMFIGTIKLNGTPLYLDPITNNTYNLEGNHWAIVFNKC